MRKEPYSKSVFVRITETSYEKLQNHADKKNKRIGEFLRDLIENYLLENIEEN
jgi:predicted DNA-binding protein